MKSLRNIQLKLLASVMYAQLLPTYICRPFVTQMYTKQHPPLDNTLIGATIVAYTIIGGAINNAEKNFFLYEAI